MGVMWMLVKMPFMILRVVPHTGAGTERNGTRRTAVGMYICSLEEGTQMSYLPSITGHRATLCRRVPILAALTAATLIKASFSASGSRE